MRGENPEIDETLGEVPGEEAVGTAVKATRVSEAGVDEIIIDMLSCCRRSNRLAQTVFGLLHQLFQNRSGE